MALLHRRRAVEAARQRPAVALPLVVHGCLVCAAPVPYIPTGKNIEHRNSERLSLLCSGGEIFDLLHDRTERAVGQVLGFDVGELATG